MNLLIVSGILYLKYGVNILLVCYFKKLYVYIFFIFKICNYF